MRPGNKNGRPGEEAAIFNHELGINEGPDVNALHVVPRSDFDERCRQLRLAARYKGITAPVVIIPETEEE